MICVPDISIYDRRLDSDDDLLVLACDGIFDVMDNVTVIENVRDIIHQMEILNEKADMIDSSTPTKARGVIKYSDVARILIRSCLALQSTDNMSVAIIPLNNC